MATKITKSEVSEIVPIMVTAFNTSGWVAYPGGTPVRYWKDLQNVVHLEGTVRFGSGGTVLFTLGAGYCPAALNQFAIVTASGIANCDIGATGEVFIGTTSNTAIVGLGHISFLAA